MKYDENELPFWEKDRGGGPISDSLKSKKRSKEWCDYQDLIQRIWVLNQELKFVWRLDQEQVLNREKERKLLIMKKEEYEKRNQYRYRAAKRDLESESAVRINGFDSNGNRHIPPVKPRS